MLQQALKSYAVYKPYYIFDAVYTPKETRLLREAAECGATVVSGPEMFIRQAMGQFKHFTGMPGTSFLSSATVFLG
jgi:3-dehydroquinate dehydratase / shikimate dehydrogenase